MPAIRPIKPASATIDERLNQVHADINAIVADRLAVEKAENPGVPLVSLEQMFWAKFSCPCKAWKFKLKDEGQ